MLTLSFRVSFGDRLGAATACFDPVTGRVGRNVSWSRRLGVGEVVAWLFWKHVKMAPFSCWYVQRCPTPWDSLLFATWKHVFMYGLNWYVTGPVNNFVVSSVNANSSIVQLTRACQKCWKIGNPGPFSKCWKFLNLSYGYGPWNWVKTVETRHE